MALFNKPDMIYKDYSWTAISGDDPRISGKPDNTLLNRHEGYEVLYLINKCLDEWRFKNMSSGQKLEKMIREGLPSNVRSQSNIKDWLKSNWK